MTAALALAMARQTMATVVLIATIVKMMCKERVVVWSERVERECVYVLSERVS